MITRVATYAVIGVFIALFLLFGYLYRYRFTK